MGQCSTLPTEGRNASSSRRGNSTFMRGEESMSQKHKEKYAHRAQTGKRSSTLQVHTQNELSQSREPGQLQSRNSETQSQTGADPMDEDGGRDGIPQPPEIATRTRCYRLNLDSDLAPQASVFLGPFMDTPPPLTYSSSEDSAEKASPTQVAIQTAKIFRGITVAKDGTILSQNARATRSNRGTKNKRGERSRQATKIDKAKDLVEETILTGKAPDSDDPANMMSLLIMGEYDDMKYLVRDGSKKLREGTEHPDDSLLVINRNRGVSTTISTTLSPRKRVSPNYVAGQRSAALHTSNKSRTMAYPQSAPPKLKGHPRDRPSTRKLDEKSRLRDSHGYHDESNRGRMGIDGDWSNALSFSRGFHSIWNCGGTGEDTGTISPTQVVSPKDGKTHLIGVTPTPYRPIYEGRGDSSYGQGREGGISARAN